MGKYVENERSSEMIMMAVMIMMMMAKMTMTTVIMMTVMTRPVCKPIVI